MEKFYTGGGIWIVEVDLNNDTYAVVSSEAPEYLTVYRKNEEKYLPEDMILSIQPNDLYVQMLKALNQ